MKQGRLAGKVAIVTGGSGTTAKALGLKIPQTLLLRTDRRRRSEGLTSERDQRTICSLVQLACS